MSLETTGVWAAGVWATTVWADGVWREGAYTPSTPAMFYGGIALNAEGATIISYVDYDFTGNAGDVFNNGSRCTSQGLLYVTTDAPSGSTVLINGFLHTANGVRYVLNGDGDKMTPDGFMTDSLSRQCITTVVSGFFIEGLLRSASGRLVVTL